MENKGNIKTLIQKFYPYAKNALGFEHPVRVVMRQDAENAAQPLGKTAYYDPQEKLIVLYITNRHPKDVLRSFSHELVHHAQNCSGQLDNLSAEGHYAEGGLGRKIERDAYDRGNMNLRDWEDGLKHKREGVNQMNEHYQIAKEEFKKLVASVVEEVVSEKKKESLKEANCEEVIKKVNDLERRANDNFRASRGNDMEHAIGSELEAEARDLREKHKNCFPQAEEPTGPGLPQGRELTFRDLDEGSKKKGKQVVTETPQQPKEVKETNKAWYDTSLYTKLKSRWTKKGDK